jgi:hypothetical protein
MLDAWTDAEEEAVSRAVLGDEVLILLSCDSVPCFFLLYSLPPLPRPSLRNCSNRVITIGRCFCQEYQRQTAFESAMQADMLKAGGELEEMMKDKDEIVSVPKTMIHPKLTMQIVRLSGAPIATIRTPYGNAIFVLV